MRCQIGIWSTICQCGGACAVQRPQRSNRRGGTRARRERGCKRRRGVDVAVLVLRWHGQTAPNVVKSWVQKEEVVGNFFCSPAHMWISNMQRPSVQCGCGAFQRGDLRWRQKLAKTGPESGRHHAGRPKKLGRSGRNGAKQGQTGPNRAERGRN